MNRRDFLAGAGATGLVGLAGCVDALGFEERERRYAPPLVEDRPDAVYVPTHVEGMNSFGMATDGPYRCALTYSYPHRFWLVTPRGTNMVEIQSDDSVHLMPVVWHAETGVVPPAANPKIELSGDGVSVPTVSPWPMLSQPMGVHFGDNVALSRNGDYAATVRASFGATDRTGALADAPDTATFDFEFTYVKQKRRTIPYRELENAGERDAVDPMRMEMLPSTQLPPTDALPGSVVGEGASGDASVLVLRVADATRFGGRESDTYLAVSPRTPYNRYPLPMASVSARVRSGGGTVFEDALAATLDPDLGYHYGAVLDTDDWTEVTVTFDAPPQINRHEGYETAFLDMPPVTVTP